MIRISDWAAEGVGQHLRTEGSGEFVFVSHQARLVFVERRELAAVWEGTADIEQRAVRAAKAFAIESLAPGTDGVVVLERSTKRIELCMARRADFVAACSSSFRRSRTVLAYSSRLSRRIGIRPPAFFAANST